MDVTAKAVGISPPAVQSVAATRLLRELAGGNTEAQEQAAYLLEGLFRNIGSFFAPDTEGDKLLKSLPRHDGVRLATALVVIGTYFEFQGNWPKMCADLDRLLFDSHTEVPPEMLEKLVAVSREMLKRDLAEAFAHRNDAPAPPAAAALPEMQASDL